MNFLFRIFDIAGPLIPGVVTAAICIAVGVGVQIRFRGETVATRFRRPMVLFHVYLFVAAAALLAKLYWPVAFHAAYMVSLLVLALALVLAVVTAVMDGFLGRYRNISVPSILRDMMIVVLYVLVILLVLHQEGVEVTSLITTSAVVTAIIGFALQDLLSNVISGLSIQMERPFKEGDWVKFDTFEGCVTEINWRATKIETRGRDIIVIPNNAATSAPLINFSAPSSVHRRRVSVGLRYEASPNRVHECLIAAARSVEGVLSNPAPQVLTRKYNDFSIDYDLLFFINDLPRREMIESNVMTRMWYYLNREGLSIPFPIRDVNVRTISAADEAAAHQNSVAELEAVISRIPEFAPLSAEERNYLAVHAHTRRFAKGECILEEGVPGISCYVVSEGQVRIETASAESNLPVELATLGADQYFGEQSLITGDPTMAAVWADTDCVLHEISKAHFGEILVRNQSLVDALGQRLSERAKERRAAQKRFGSESRPGEESTEPAGFVRRIRSFFQL
ncbi:MAG: mechanosensitive ion channel [Deltaproteobacteria bacterium]|nr:mechanosensitive ion channel [Deltaproteobacteria bacterium]MBN2672250.1 mechanosensitive ion channel [Deltaproteobacteria bacterium]